MYGTSAVLPAVSALHSAAAGATPPAVAIRWTRRPRCRARSIPGDDPAAIALAREAIEALRSPAYLDLRARDLDEEPTAFLAAINALVTDTDGEAVG